MNQRSPGCRVSWRICRSNAACRAHTDTNYRARPAALRRLLRPQSRPRLARVDSQHVRMFAAAEFRQGSSPRTIQRRLSAMRSFYNFLLRESALEANPAVGVQAPKARKRLPATIDVDLMTRLLELPHRRSSSACATRRSWSCSIPPACACRSWSAWISATSISPIAPCACSAKAARPASCRSASTRSRRSRAGCKERTDARGSRRARRCSSAIAANARRPRGAEARRGWARRQGLGVHVHPAHVPPLLRHAPAGIEPGPARRAGIARPREHLDDAGLHAP